MVNDRQLESFVYRNKTGVGKLSQSWLGKIITSFPTDPFNSPCYRNAKKKDSFPSFPPLLFPFLFFLRTDLRKEAGS